MAKSSNFIVRGGADFSGIKKEIQKTQGQLSGFQSGLSKLMGKIGIALGSIAVGKLIKDSTKVAMGVESAMDNISRNMGNSSKAFQDWVNTQSKALGMGKAEAYKYGSTFSNLLSSFQKSTKETADSTQELMKAAAIISSKTGRSYEDTANRIRSGMLGSTEAIEDLGVYTNISMIQSTQAFKKFANGKTWAQLDFQTQQQIRLTAILEQAYARYGDTLADTTATRQSQFLASLKNIQLYLGQAFLPIYNVILPALTKMADAIGFVVSKIAQFSQALFGKANVGAVQNAEDTTEQTSAMAGLGDATEETGKQAKKAGKEAKNALAPFDELNVLSKTSTSSGEDSGGGSAGLPSGIDIGETAEPSEDSAIGQIAKLKTAIEDFYNNWGAKDIFDGIKAGAALVNFDGIKENLTTAFSGWGEIAQTAIDGLQPIMQSAGQLIGTQFKYGIAIAGNLFEPIATGFANFTANMQGPIQVWIAETSTTISKGLDNLTTAWENIGQSWLTSIEKYKPEIEKVAEDTFTNIANTFMLVGTVLADTFEIITGHIKDFAENSKEDFQKFTDSIVEMFTDAGNLVNEIWSDSLGLLKEFWDTWGKDFVDGVMGFVDDIGKWFLYLWNELIKPIWDKMFEWMKKIWDESLKDIVKGVLEFVGKVGELLKTLWDLIQPIIDWLLKHVVPVIREVFNKLMDEIIGPAFLAIGDFIKGLLKSLNGVLDFLIGVFSGDWERAWNGIKEIFQGFADSLIAIFKIPLNWIIDGINDFIKGLNKIEIPDWVPIVGGKGFKIPTIPKLGAGAIINKPTIAMVGEAGREAVMPLENNTSWIDDLAGKIATGIVSTMQITGNSGNGEGATVVLTINDRKIAQTILPALNDEAERLGYESILRRG